MSAALALLISAVLSTVPVPMIYDVPVPERARALFSVKGIVVVVEAGVEVRDPRTGSTRWKRGLSSDSRNERPVAIIENLVIVTDAKAVVACSIDTGEVVWRTEVGWVAELSAGPALLVGVNQKETGSILRLDHLTGKILARRIVRPIESLAQTSNATLAVLLPNESDGPGYVVAGYKTSDFTELWRFRQTGSAEFQKYDNETFFASLSAVYPLDLATGERGAKLPSTDPVESIWGGSTREIETIDDRDSFSQIRRNDVRSGRPRWVTEVPFEIFNTLRDGDLLYVSGGVGNENEPHYAATIDWSTGVVKKLIGPVPFVFQWGKVGRAIVATTWSERLVSFVP